MTLDYGKPRRLISQILSTASVNDLSLRSPDIYLT